MKYIVGYQLRNDDSFSDAVIKYGDSIKELYFSFGDFASGRMSLGSGATLFEDQQKQMSDVFRIAEAGVKINMLFNANCYGEQSQSRAFFNKIGDTVDYVASKAEVTSVTTASPLIAKFIHENFKGVDVRASVNMEIGSIEGMSYIKQYFDSFYVKRELNRDINALRRLRAWCDENGREMYLLANSGCLNNCSAHTFHDNLVAHEAGIAKMDNGYGFNGICWEYLSTAEGRKNWLLRTNFIRPEDVHLFEGLVPAMKLATRVNSAPVRVLRAYVEGRYRGAVTGLLEPDHSCAFAPEYIENADIPGDFMEYVLSCDKNCAVCERCAETAKKATVTLNDDFTLKV